MARGAEEKTIIFNKIKSTFPESFWETPDKILRIPINDVEIKVQLTCPRDNIGGVSNSADNSVSNPATVELPSEITPEEKKEVKEMILELGL